MTHARYATQQTAQAAIQIAHALLIIITLKVSVIGVLLDAHLVLMVVHVLLATVICISPKIAHIQRVNVKTDFMAPKIERMIHLHALHAMQTV